MQYAEEVAGQTEESLGLLCPDDAVCPQLLFRDHERVLDSGFPLEECDENGHANWHMPYAWRRWERQNRHRLNVLLNVHNREVFGLTPLGLERRFGSIPGWWINYEVPFG